MKTYYWVGLIFCAQVSYAGLFEDEEARKKLNSIQDQLNNIQSNIQSNIDAKVNQVLKNRNANPVAIKNQNTLQEIQEMLMKINGEVEVLQFKINNFQEREKVLYQEINDRLTNLENNSQPEVKDSINELINNQELINNSKPKNAASSIDQNTVKDLQNLTRDEDVPNLEELIIADNVPPLIDQNIEIDEFEKAKASMMATKYNESFNAFDRFISTYPNSQKIADAKYFLGYSQFALRNYNAAIKTYSKILESHSESTILTDAIYGIANCQIQLAKIADAKKTLRQLIEQYPDAEIISKAKRRLKALESINL